MLLVGPISQSSIQNVDVFKIFNVSLDLSTIYTGITLTSNRPPGTLALLQAFSCPGAFAGCTITNL